MENSTEIDVDSYKITKILADDASLFPNWKIFSASLGLSNALIQDLEQTHNRSGLSTQELFMSIMRYWKCTSSAKANLEKLQQKLRELERRKCADCIEALQPSQSIICQNIEDTPKIWFNVLQPTRFYLGRKPAMEMLEKHWNTCKNEKRIYFVAITGLGGIGKSEIARNFATYFYENINGDCIWMNAENKQSLSEDLQQLAKSNKLKVSLTDQSGREKVFKALVEDVYKKLSGGKCLIILDNLQSYDARILNLLHDLANKQLTMKPFVVVTSRFRPPVKFYTCNGVLLEVADLPKDSSVQFFRESFGLKENTIDPEIENLCEILQNHPLAMQQAAAYIHKINYNLPTTRCAHDFKQGIALYLENLEAEDQVLLNQKHTTDEQLENMILHKIHLIFRLTFNKMKESCRLETHALEFVKVLSFLCPENISADLVSKIFHAIKNLDKPVSLQHMFKKIKYSLKALVSQPPTLFNHHDIFQLLKDHSLINFTGNKVSIHRLVQKSAIVWLKEQKIHTVTLDSLLTCVGVMLSEKEIPSDQLSHTEMIWKHAMKNHNLVNKHAEIAISICWSLYTFGRYRYALDYATEAFNTLESVLGTDDRWALKMKYWKAALLSELGEYAESLDLLTEVHKIQKEKDSIEDSLATFREIGKVHYRLKDFEKAIECYEVALTTREQFSGPDHSETLRLKNDIGLFFQEQGEHAYSLKLFNEVFEVRQRIWGSEHEETLTIKHNLGIAEAKQNNYEKALTIFKQVLEVREKTMDANHPNTFRAKFWIISMRKCLGDSKDLLACHTNDVYLKQLEILGEHHLHTKEFC